MSSYLEHISFGECCNILAKQGQQLNPGNECRKSFPMVLSSEHFLGNQETRWYLWRLWVTSVAMQQATWWEAAVCEQDGVHSILGVCLGQCSSLGQRTQGPVRAQGFLHRKGAVWWNHCAGRYVLDHLENSVPPETQASAPRTGILDTQWEQY